MMKRILSSLVVLLLVTVLTVCAFAAENGGKSSLALMQTDSINYTALEEDDVFTVYILLDPMVKPSGKDYLVYRPYANSGIAADAAVGSSSADLFDHTFTVSWDPAHFEYVSIKTQDRSTASPTSYATADGKTVYLAYAATTGQSSVLKPEVEDKAGSVNISYNNRDKNFTGYVVQNKDDSTTSILGCIAAIELKVISAPTDKDTSFSISLGDTYERPENASQTFSTSVSVTVKKGCSHTNKTDVTEISATCITDGKYSFSCADCGKSYDISVPATGHAWTYKKIDPTCVTGGKEFYYCENEDCKHLAKVFTQDVAPEKNADVDANTVYNETDGMLYTDRTFTTIQNSPVMGAVKSTGNLGGHKWVKDINGTYVCENVAEGTCNGAKLDVRYVGNVSKGNGDTPGTCSTLAAAFEHFAADKFNYDGVTEGYIYLVEDIKLSTARAVSSNITRNAFEENPHDVHITITSVDKANPRTITFGESCTDYYLYGATTFEYLNIAAEKAGTAGSGGIYICGRGFKLVMGYGINMLGDDIDRTDGGDSNAKKASKTDASIAGFGTTVVIPNAKVYVVAGVKNGGIQDGFEKTALNAEMELYSGQYWSVLQYNSGNVAAELKNARSKVTIGAITADTVITTPETVKLTNCHSVLLYVDDFNIKLDHAIGFSDKETGSGNRLDRLYLPGVTENAKLGDFALNKAFNVYGDMTVYYYDGLLDNSTKSHFVIAGFEAKEEVAVKNGYSNFNMNTASISEWCANYGEEFFGIEGGHDYNSDGICSFCGFKQCMYHIETAFRVTKEPNCQEDGIEQEYCTRCFTILSEKDIPTTGEHSYAWDAFASEVKCTVCNEGNGIVVDSAKCADIYVSDKGTAFGGFSADDPLNNFNVAMKLAAKASGDATIYVIGKVVVASNTSDATYYTFTEPSRSNKITIRGYGDTKGVVEFGGGTGTMKRIVYNLSGSTAFEQVELSAGTCPEKVYIAARHNPIEFGLGVSADMQALGSDASTSRIAVLGGCYDAQSGCGSNVNTNMTFYSGNYCNIFGAGSNSNCCPSEIDIRILGDVTVMQFAVLGAYAPLTSLAETDITLELDGNVSCAEYFSFSCYASSDKYMENSVVRDVTLILRGGTIITETYKKAPVEGRIVGTGGESGDSSPTDRKHSLTVYYNPAENSTKTLANKIAVSSDKSICDGTCGNQDCAKPKFEAKILTDDGFCSVTNGSHVEGAVVEGTTPVEATCYAEGYKTVTCTECGEEYTATIPTLPHVTELKTTLEATCVSPELEMYACTNEGCNAVEYEIVSGSTALDPTAFESHNVENGVCTVCKKSVVQICADRSVKNDDDGTGHDYTSSAVNKSCGSGTAYECKDCGYTWVYIDSESHNYGAYSVTVEPTETAPGVKSRTCKSCGKVDTALLYAADSIYTEAVATDASGNVADIDIATSKLSKYEREALNSLLQSTAYGSEVKVSYKVEGDTVTDVTYSIPVPAEYSKMTNVKVIVKDDDGVLHTVDFVIEKGYFVFTF